MGDEKSEYLNMEDGEARETTENEGKVEQGGPDTKSSDKSGYSAPEIGEGGADDGSGGGGEGDAGGASQGGGSTGEGGGASQGGGSGN